MQLFVDMDGVLADFDTHHEATFGFRSCKIADNVDWKAVREVADFYLHIPPMADFDQLWPRIQPYKPVVLTGVPSSVPEAAGNKRAWVAKHIGTHVEVISCPSRHKSLHASAGDVLIDDWEKYKNLWLAKGGRWITHTSAADTDRALAGLGL